ASLEIASTLVFVDASTFASRFTTTCCTLLDVDRLEKIDDDAIAVWKTEPGTLYVDVLRRGQKVENKNRKDYETEKWEREVKEAIAKKKGQSLKQKLSKEEQALVNAQLEKEATTRAFVQDAHDNLRNGLDLARHLISGSPIAMEEELTRLTPVLLHGAIVYGEALVGDLAVQTFLDMSRALSPNLARARSTIAYAILRSFGATCVADNWQAEPLKDTVVRALYRVRFATERNPLSPGSFAYCFPLVQRVIQENGIGYPEGVTEKTTEQTVVAVDIIKFHAAQCGCHPLRAMPRRAMLEALQVTIRDHPKLIATAKNALESACDAMSDTVELAEVQSLYNGLLWQSEIIADALLQSFDLSKFGYSRELWAACHDKDDSIAATAAALWNENDIAVPEAYIDSLLDLVVNGVAPIRASSGRALAAAVDLHPTTLDSALRAIYAKYELLAAPLVPRYDKFGIVIPESLNQKDPWESRAALGATLQECCLLMKLVDLESFVTFLLDRCALGDRDERVRKAMLDAGWAAVKAHGKEHLAHLMPVFEKYLKSPAKPDETHDRIRESAVVLYGGTAQFLDPEDPRIAAVVDRLIDTLKTPSEPVQIAVAQCLPPLIKCIKGKAPELVDRLMDRMLHSRKFAERRGSAFGLAGVVKGYGLALLKERGIMAALKESAEDKRHVHARQGAMFAFEAFAQMLGRLFEPYIIQVVPLLLTNFGDSNKDVRDATIEASRMIMSKISGHCVKLIMPSLMTGLHDRQWRTQRGSVELLGSMAYCAPKQLSVSLPYIVPRLVEVLNDSHQSVQEASREALLNFGQVISNPEIQELVPTLMTALCDPDTKTKLALSALLETSFVHYIDSPSLALIMPIIQRGLRERGTDTKKRSAQIIGNLSALTNAKDFTPYLTLLMPGLNEVLVDPVPEARATAAMALGVLVQRLGEEHFPNLVQELLHTLKSDTSGVDRQGAAQGLSEVLAGLGIQRLDDLFPDIIANTSSPKAYVREGFVSLLIYLPVTFGVRFQPYLGRIIPPVLVRLADESDYVREASLKAGQIIVNNFATSAVELLLPELERGLFNVNWRIRQSSVQLMGDLLYKITGLNTRSLLQNSTLNAGAGTGIAPALLDALGQQRRDSVLAALYVVRSDVSAVVRQAAVFVWKSIVFNTPRTIKEILPSIMEIVLHHLASPVEILRREAALTLGDLVRKLGESILVRIIPLLSESLKADDSNRRQGACIGLSEVMVTAGKVHVLDYVEPIVATVRAGLCDPLSEVREAAAQAFDTLHGLIGPKAIDDIIPALLNELNTGDASEYALEGLKEIMAVRANVVFPVLVPTLVHVPVSEFNANALSALISVAGTALSRRLELVLNSLMNSLQQEDQAAAAAVSRTIEVLVANIEDEDAVHSLMMRLFEKIKDDSDASTRAATCRVLASFAQSNSEGVHRYVGDWLRTLIDLLTLSDKELVQAALTAADVLVKSQRKDDLDRYINTVRGSFRRVAERLATTSDEIPGLCVPKAVAPFLTVYLQGLMNGGADVREISALGLGELVQHTSQAVLRPYVTQITGPLIRVIGERYPPPVKAAILQTLGTLLSKVSALLKPFLPQLQRTFIKSLSDPNAAVRSRAATALGTLITLQTRVDTLVSELCTGIRTNTEGIRETMLNALRSVLAKAGDSMNEASRQAVEKVIAECLLDGPST
ncbi:armadillo-type protein, partial [Thamnocephalis sphaerospora]